MLYWLLYPLKDSIVELSFFRVIGYVPFRAVFAALTSLFILYFIGNQFISFLNKINFKENIYEDGPERHHQKKSTPTMGGILILMTTLFSVILWGNFSNRYLWTILVCTSLLGVLGFWDDYTKSVKNISKGIPPKFKLLFQILISLGFSYMIYYYPYTPKDDLTMATALYIPFFKEPILILNSLAIPFWTLVILSTSNSVNLTDGLDGLAAGLCAIVLGTLGIISYLTGVFPIADHLLIPFVPEANELCIFIAAFLGALVGFLWYNSYPATVFMGDTGSLAIGGSIGMIAICIKRELLLIILGGIFVTEALSVIFQVTFYKTKRKRIFLMAPLHHHYELKGLDENKIVIRFWIIGILLALISLSSLKII